jgi:O-antigen ligase
LTAFLVVNFARAHELVPQLTVLRLGKLSGVPLVLLAIGRLPRRRLRAAVGTGPGRGVLFIGAMMVLSIPLSIWPGNSFGYVTGQGVILYIMFVTTAAVLVDGKVIPVVLKTLTVAVLAGAAQMLTPWAHVAMEGGTPRVHYGFTYDPNDTAALMLVMIPIALYLATRSGSRSWLWYGASLVMVAAIVRTGSRGGLLGLGAMVLALVTLATPKHRARFVGAAAATLIAFAAVAGSNSAVRDRFLSTFSSEQTDYNYTAANGRLELWKRGVHYMVTHPVTGVGVANYPVAELTIGSEIKRQQGIYSKHMFTAHNSLILIGAELGVPGLAAFLFVVATAFAGLWRVRRGALDASAAGNLAAGDLASCAAAVMASLSGLFVGGLFLSLSYSPMTLFTFALSAALIGGAPLVLTAPAGGTIVGEASVRPVSGRRGGLRLHVRDVGGSTRAAP